MDKEYILKEIIRTAEENDGVPLGEARFFSETGIKKYDWHGKYWLRWSDAQKEAGFEPTSFNQGFSDDFLIKKLIELIREIGKFPIAGEIKLKHNNDKNFPALAAFTRRHKKNDWLKLLIEYCQKNDNLSDVLKICQAIYQPDQEINEKEIKCINKNFGFVYLLKSGRHYKIGRSNNAYRRNYDINLQLPEKASLIHQIKTDDPVGIEEYWHKRFATCRKNGEWFELTARDISAFKRRKFM